MHLNFKMKNTPKLVSSDVYHYRISLIHITENLYLDLHYYTTAVIVRLSIQLSHLHTDSFKASSPFTITVTVKPISKKSHRRLWLRHFWLILSPLPSLSWQSRSPAGNNNTKTIIIPAGWEHVTWQWHFLFGGHYLAFSQGHIGH